MVTVDQRVIGLNGDGNQGCALLFIEFSNADLWHGIVMAAVWKGHCRETIPRNDAHDDISL